MNKILLISFFIFLNISVVNAVAGTVTGTNFDMRGPDSITTTVGKLTEVRIDIFNKLSTTDSYTVLITKNPINVVEVTNPSITTQIANPKQNIQIASNIRTLTEDSAVVIFAITSTGTSEKLTLTVPISSKKFSLPEFGLIGFLQIIILASVGYFLFGTNRRK